MSSKTMSSGLFWSFLERICSQGIALVISIILARLLSVDDFGIVSAVQIFISIATVFVTGGISSALIYKKDIVKAETHNIVRPMMRQMYERLLSDLTLGKNDSPIFTHHIDYVNKAHYKRDIPYKQTEPNQIVVDYIASMTDDYFTDLYAYLFPKSDLKINYKGYFD